MIHYVHHLLPVSGWIPLRDLILPPSVQGPRGQLVRKPKSGAIYGNFASRKDRNPQMPQHYLYHFSYLSVKEKMAGSGHIG
jgi:hypothetical protein